MKEKIIRLTKLLIKLLEDIDVNIKHEVFEQIIKYNYRCKLKFNEVKLYYHNNYKITVKDVVKNYYKYDYLLYVDNYNYKIIGNLPKNKNINLEDIELEFYKCEFTHNKLDGCRIFLKPIEKNNDIKKYYHENIVVDKNDDSFSKLINDL